MDREEGFPPHIIGFMKRKREKENWTTRRRSNPSLAAINRDGRIRTPDRSIYRIPVAGVSAPKAGAAL